MDKTKQQPSFTKEQRIRYIKALLRGAKAEMDKKEKARKEANYPSYQEQRENLKQAEINRLSRLIQEEKAKLPKGAWPSPKLNELEYELQAISNTLD